jgi:hypothetical protein
MAAHERAEKRASRAVVRQQPDSEAQDVVQHQEPAPAGSPNHRPPRVTKEPEVAPHKAQATQPAPPTTRARGPSATRATVHTMEPPAPAASMPSAPAPRAELELLQRARRVVQAAPQRALELAEQHRATFPSGTFAEERELLAIEALLELAKPAEAEARARRFTAQFPRSVHAQRLSTLLTRAQESSEVRAPAAHSQP